MKKARLLTLLLVLVMLLPGCKQKALKIDTSDIDTDTMLIKSNGTVQVATVESFEESYYDKSELKSFITDHITEYNQSIGQENAVQLKSLDVKDKKAVMLLEYASMKDFSDFTETNASAYDSLSAEALEQLPDVLQKGKKDETIAKTELSSHSDLKAAIIDAKYDLMVNGGIKYYSNGTLEDENTIKTGENGPTIVVY